jgi:hypothetical protein
MVIAVPGTCTTARQPDIRNSVQSKGTTEMSLADAADAQYRIIKEAIEAYRFSDSETQKRLVAALEQANCRLRELTPPKSELGR